MLRALILAVLLSGCAVKTEPEVIKAINQNTIILDAVVTYIEGLQEKGVLPKPEALKEEPK